MVYEIISLGGARQRPFSIGEELTSKAKDPSYPGRWHSPFFSLGTQLQCKKEHTSHLYTSKMLDIHKEH